MSKRMTRKKAQDLLAATQDLTPINEHVPKPLKVDRLEPMNEAQSIYLDLIRTRDVVFALGPAGTGKSYIAVAEACNMLIAKTIDRIIVTRPVVEAGESLGFLPGELTEKFDPYFAPIRSILNERLGEGFAEYCQRKEKIVAQPLAYMRGHTFKDAFVILDEAQNCTPKQMKMFLTRLGEPVKCVIDGDEGQIDIDVFSGLEDAVYRFREHRQFGVVHFTLDDIVRSGLVREVLIGYNDNSFQGLPRSAS